MRNMLALKDLIFYLKCSKFFLYIINIQFKKNAFRRVISCLFYELSLKESVQLKHCNIPSLIRFEMLWRQRNKSNRKTEKNKFQRIKIKDLKRQNYSW